MRALTPHIGARLELPDGSLLGVRAAQLAPDARVPTGTLDHEGKRLLLGCADDTVLELTCVQPPGGRPMTAADYLRGRQS